MDPKPSITFYDISSAPPPRTYAPNPWKTRFALNFKGVPYQTQWVDMPDITALREGLGVPANRSLPDGTPYHTLPVIQDTSTGTLIGDTFEIALYLDKAYPDGPSLFRPNTIGLTAAWNSHVDGVFTKFSQLCIGMPIPPRIQDAVRAMFLSRAGMSSWEDLQLSAEQRETMFVAFEAALGELAKAYRHTGGTTDYFWRPGGTDKAQSQRAPEGREAGGPFLDGDAPAYADFIIGAWLKMFQTCLEKEEWQRVSAWQDGLWGRVVDALGRWSTIK